MTRTSYLFLLGMLLVLGACRDDESQGIDGETSELADLAVSVDREDEIEHADRSFVFSNKKGAFLFDSAVGIQSHEAMGYSINGLPVLQNWAWWISEDSTELGESERSRSTIRPDMAFRDYAEQDSAGFFGRIFNRIRGEKPAAASERVALLDEIGALYIAFTDSLGEVAFRPVPAGNVDSVEVRDGTLLMLRDSLWLAFRGEANAQVLSGAASDSRYASYGEISFESPGEIVAVTASSKVEADSLVRLGLDQSQQMITARTQRLTQLLEQSSLTTENDQINRAVAWSRILLDALVVSDSSSAVLLPGLPGAETNDGRSIPAAYDAFIATGQWELVRKLLVGIGNVQRFDERIDVLGRAPNSVSIDRQGRFQTADATSHFISSIGDYVRASGDRGLISGSDNFWFKTVFAMRGLYQEGGRHRTQVSDRGFVTAGPDETWMINGSSKPELQRSRMGYPVEMQGVQYQALRAMTTFAQIMGVSGRETATWYADSAEALRSHFESDFVNGGVVADYLDANGQSNTDYAGNALLALRAMEFPSQPLAERARQIAEQAFRYGLPTRSQSDSLFHPYLDSQGTYPAPDALYNGPIWTWHSGVLISLMTRTGAKEFANELLEEHVQRVQSTGVIGAIPERIDGHPYRGESDPRAGGTPLDPWAQSEFLRNVYQDFVGLEHLIADTVQITPNIPEKWNETSVAFRVRDARLQAVLEQRESQTDVTLSVLEGVTTNLVVRVRALDKVVDVAIPDSLAVGEETTISIGSEIVVNGEPLEANQRYGGGKSDWWSGFTWSEATIPEEYPVLDLEVVQSRVTPEQILRDNLAASTILSQADPDGDDWGATSTYTYPADFTSSILDATFLEIAEDDSTTYFRGEFVDLASADSAGTGLTFVAIAIDRSDGGQRAIGRNAHYNYPSGNGYEEIIYLGGGLLVEGVDGRILAELRSSAGTVFDTATASFAFAIPKSALPALVRGDDVTMLVGAYADADGPGQFRRVDRGPSGYNGGGKVNARSPNVYDVVNATVAR